MALTGHLSDLSLSELIEFFCNQRKSGRLKVLYPQGPGYFYLQTGSVVDARIGVLRGIDAVYYALTLPNAKFEFSGSAEASDRTINQPWTQVVLEGLRRLDESITPVDAFPANYRPEKDEPDSGQRSTSSDAHTRLSHVPAFLSFISKESIAQRKPLLAVAVAVAVLGSVAAIGVPAGWYNRAKAATASNQSATSAPFVSEQSSPTVAEAPTAEAPESGAGGSAAAVTSRRQRERDRAKARAAMVNQPSSGPSSVATVPAKAGPKKVAVTVTYDESGRVVQASGGDPSALRIARQKRFPPGKAGTATVTISIN